MGNREQLVKMLHGNEVDIAIMGRPPTELATRAEPFAAHPHVFVAPVDHPLLKVGHPTPDSLRPYGFIPRERGSGTRAAMEAVSGTQSRMEPRVVMEMSSNETIKQAVMAGMGISFLSLHTIGLELEHKMIAVLDVEGTPDRARLERGAHPVQAAVTRGRVVPLFHARAGRAVSGRRVRSLHATVPVQARATSPHAPPLRGSCPALVYSTPCRKAHPLGVLPRGFWPRVRLRKSL